MGHLACSLGQRSRNTARDGARQTRPQGGQAARRLQGAGGLIFFFAVLFLLVKTTTYNIQVYVDVPYAVSITVVFRVVFFSYIFMICVISTSQDICSVAITYMGPSHCPSPGFTLVSVCFACRQWCVFITTSR